MTFGKPEVTEGRRLVARRPNQGTRGLELSIVHPSFCPTLGKKGRPLRQSVASGRWFNQPCLGKEASMKPRGWGSESGQVPDTWRYGEPGAWRAWELCAPSHHPWRRAAVRCMLA